VPTSTVFFATGLGYYLYNYGTRGQFTKMRLLLFSIELVQWTGGEGLWRLSDHACLGFACIARTICEPQPPSVRQAKP